MWFEKRVSADYNTLLYEHFIFASLDIIFIFTLSQTPLFYKNYRINFRFSVMRAISFLWGRVNSDEFKSFVVPAC